MSDEDVIRRRLLIDADGTGDDRRLNVLMKSFMKWCNTTEKQELIDHNHDRLLSSLSQCEFAMKKSNIASEMMKREQKNYEKSSVQINAGIEMVKLQIAQNKENYEVAKKIRKNRMEYDALAKIINQQPDRKETMQKLEELASNSRELEAKSTYLERKLEKKQKDFTVLMRAIHELQEQLSDDSSDDEDEEEPMDAEESTEELVDEDDDEGMILG